MADLDETIRLVELICARLCHDLGGLIGTVGNAVDMVIEDSGPDSEVLAFASSAAKLLMQRLRLMRAAWGPESDPQALAALTALAQPALAARRIALDTRALPADGVFAPSTGRVLLNLILLASDSMPKGGTIVLVGEPADLLVRIDGPGAAWPPGFAPCMHDPIAAIAAVNAGRTVQMPLTALLALSRGLRLSPVLGPASGIQAVRLSGAPGSSPRAPK
jgi:histidine phosphotransferase ChpT